MNGDGPGHAQGELRIGSQFLLFYFLLLVVESVSDVAPDFAFNIQFPAVFGNDEDALVFLFVKAYNGS